MQQPSYLSDSVHAVLRLQDLAEGEEVCLLSELFHADVSLLGKHTWEMRLSQPILLRPAAARMMAAKSSFSSSFFKRVLRFPRWERALRKPRQKNNLQTQVSPTEKKRV